MGGAFTPWQASVTQAWEAACAGPIPNSAVIEGPGGDLMSPRADAFGRAMFQSGLIERLQTDNHPVCDVVDRLAEMLVTGTISAVSSS